MSPSAQFIYLIIFIISVGFSIFFPAAETAFMSLQRVRLQHMVATNVKGASRVARLLQKPERLLSIILLGDSLADTTTAVVGTTLSVMYLGDHGGTLITAIILTIIALVIGGSIPKTIASRYPDRFAIALALPIELLQKLFTPFVYALGWFTSAVTRLVGAKPVAHSIISTDEIKTMMPLGHKEGVVEKDEAEMLHNVFQFGDRPVREVIVPRLDVVAIESGSKVSDYFALYGKSPFSRFPVFKDNLDNITGIVIDKDILTGIAKGTITPDTRIDDLVRPAYFTPDSKRISKLFGEMRGVKIKEILITKEEHAATAR